MKLKFCLSWFCFITFCSFNICLVAQNTIDEQRTKRNRRIADSLYYVHTIKPQQDSIKQAAIKQITADSSKTKNTKKIVLSIDTCQKTNNGQNVFPCQTLYQNTWVTQRVKNSKVSLKDIPDEIILRLLGKDNKGDFCFPYKGKKTSGYGWRWGRAHTGLDIALNTGDKVYAAFDGVVRVACYNGGYGNMVLIRHYNNLETLYGHLCQINVKSGQKVKAGDVIGLGGSTGNSTGPHLHFECRLLYACFDPEWILDVNTYKLKTKFVRIDKSYFGLPASQAAADKKYYKTKLCKVDRLLDGTSYLNQQEFKLMVDRKEIEKTLPVKINNEDKSSWRYYRVKQGDTVETICKRYRITMQDLIAINNLKDNELEIGQKIRVR